MIRFIPLSFPGRTGLPPKGMEMTGEVQVTKDYLNIHPDLLPEFFGQVGRIEGYLTSLTSHWLEGEVTLTVKKGSYELEGILSQYEDEVNFYTIMQAVEGLARALSVSFTGAESYLAVFKFSNLIEYPGKSRQKAS